MIARRWSSLLSYCKCEEKASQWVEGVFSGGGLRASVFTPVFGEGRQVYQSHSVNLSKAFCVPTSEREQLSQPEHDSAFEPDRCHMPR